MNRRHHRGLTDPPADQNGKLMSVALEGVRRTSNPPHRDCWASANAYTGRSRNDQIATDVRFACDQNRHRVFVTRLMSEWPKLADAPGTISPGLPI
jgi:hypothetical protein